MKKIKRILSVLLSVLLMVTVLSGCWDSEDINDKLIVTAIVFDIKDDEIWFYLEIANTESGGGDKEGGGGGGGDKFTVSKGHGKTLAQVRDNLDTQLDKPLFLSGVRTLLFTEKFANKYMVEYLYRYRVDDTYRKKGLTVITKEDPEELLKNSHENNTSLGFAVEGTIDSLKGMGKAFSRTTARLIENLSSKYTGILMPCIGMQDKAISLESYAVVYGDKVTGYIPVDEAKGTLFLKIDNAKFFYVVPYKDTNFSLEVVLNKRKIEPSYVNNKVSFKMSFDFVAEVEYGDKKTPYHFEDTAKKDVSALLQSVLEKEITGAIELSQKKFQCDYLQLDDIFRTSYPEAFDKMNWGQAFASGDIKIEVKTNVTTKWSIDYGTNAVR